MDLGHILGDVFFYLEVFNALKDVNKIGGIDFNFLVNVEVSQAIRTGTYVGHVSGLVMFLTDYAVYGVVKLSFRFHIFEDHSQLLTFVDNVNVFGRLYNLSQNLVGTQFWQVLLVFPVNHLQKLLNRHVYVNVLVVAVLALHF